MPCISDALSPSCNPGHRVERMPGARDRTRTGTPLAKQGILSPRCLPFHHPGGSVKRCVVYPPAAHPSGLHHPAKKTRAEGQKAKKGAHRSGRPFPLGAGNETCTRRVSRCFPNSFFAEVVSEDLNCSLVFRPRQQYRPKSSTGVHRPALSTQDTRSAHRQTGRTRTGHPRSVLWSHIPAAMPTRQMLLVSRRRSDAAV